MPLLVSFTFDVYWEVLFSLHAGKGTSCMWLVDKVKISFPKIGFKYSKWFNLNAPVSYAH